MRVIESIETFNGKAKIEFGDSSWDDAIPSVRIRWDTQEGRYDPISSSELSFPMIAELVVQSASRDMITVSEAGRMVGALGASIQRQSSKRGE